MYPFAQIVESQTRDLNNNAGQVSHASGGWLARQGKILLETRAKQLIDLIDNHDYWEIIDVLTIIMMSNIHMVNKKSHQTLDYASNFDAKCNI